MAVFSIPASFSAIYMQDSKTVNEYGLLYGFDSIVWLTVLWYGVGGNLENILRLKSFIV